MSREQATRIWNNLKCEGWERDGIMLTKHEEEGLQRFFTFVAKGDEFWVSYMELEVTF